MSKPVVYVFTGNSLPAGAWAMAGAVPSRVAARSTAGPTVARIKGPPQAGKIRLLSGALGCSVSLGVRRLAERLRNQSIWVVGTPKNTTCPDPFGDGHDSRGRGRG